MSQSIHTFGALLQSWRRRRRLSQLDLAAEAEVSQRHLSFVESGRSAPSREMVLRLAERLSVPMRERNALLVAAGYAPVFAERRLDDPALEAARAAVERILAGHEPHPALAVDRHWSLVSANRAVAPLLAGVDPALLAPPANVLRLSLHPDGLGPRIANYRDWRAHVAARLTRQIDLTADPGLITLREEIAAYPAPQGARPPTPGRAAALEGVAAVFELEMDGGRLSFLTTTTIFGTALDITLSELTVEAFFPADAATAEAMRRMLDGAGAAR